MEIERDMVKEKVSLTQKAFLQKVLQKFDVGCETKAVSTHLSPHLKTIDKCEYMSHIPYVSAVGCLSMLWCTRSQICHWP